MYVERVSIKGFRNLQSQNIELTPGINVFSGDNAQGKTNLLEAVYICSTGRSQRAHSDRELIDYSADNAYVQAYVRTRRTDKIEVHLKRTGKKGVAINGLPIRKLGQLFGNLLTVIFSPEDLRLVKSGPAERRRFMDVSMCQLSAVYYQELQQYYHVLNQRNNLLKSIRTAPALRETVAVWDEQLVSHGVRVIKSRRAFIEDIGNRATAKHRALCEKESLRISYRPSAEADELAERLTRALERDIILGSTSVGAHKDDILFTIDGNDTRIYGSQGQQRTAALATKLAEVALIMERKRTSPVLLLDDVLSELDAHRRRMLIKSIDDVQTIITCTDADLNLPATAMFTVTQGQIERINQ